MKLMKRGAAVAIGASAATVALTALPAFAANTGTLTPDPYPVPQSSPGVPNMAAVNVEASGLTPGTGYSAGYCDGLPDTNPSWSGTSDCGPFSATINAPANGILFFGGDADSANPPPQSFPLWHGSSANDPVFGEEPFNCLAPDDNPQSTTTAEGNQPIDPNEPAWGATAPVGPVQGGGQAPCNILVSYSSTPLASNSVEDPVDLTAAATTPESPLAVALPIGGAVIFLAAGAFVMRRRRHTTAAA